MGAFKDKKSGSWYVQFRYTDWQGIRNRVTEIVNAELIYN